MLVREKMYQFVEFVWFGFEKLGEMFIAKSEIVNESVKIGLPSFSFEVNLISVVFELNEYFGLLM